MSIYKIRKIDKDNDSEEYWQDIYEYKKECAEISGVDFEEKPLASFKSSYLVWLINGGASYLIWKNDKPAGYFGFDVYHKKNAEKRQVVLSSRLINDCVDEGLCREVFKCCLAYDPSFRYFYFKSKNKDDDFISSVMDVKPHDFRKSFELNLATVNKEELVKNVDLNREKYSDYSLKFYEILPDELVKPYCELFVELCKEMKGNPNSSSCELKEDEFKDAQESLTKNEVLELRYLLYDSQNKLIGVTSLGINKKKIITGYQHLTGISKEYRGRGLSKFLRYEMLLKLQNSYPDVNRLETEIHNENYVSIKLNESMGYKEKGYRKLFLIPKKRIEEWLQSSGEL